MGHDRELLIPEPLRPGDLVGVVAPCGPVEEGALVRGITFLERLGFRVVQGDNCTRQRGYLAGHDRQRLENLTGMLESPEIRAVLFARGGYGSMRILDGIDCGAIRRDPKILLGMSDATALQLSLFARCGLVSLSGPMVAGQMAKGLDEPSERSLVDALTLPFAGKDLVEAFAATARVIRHGRAEGLFLGGCLSLVTSLLGTAHVPDFSGAVLFLEDVNEPPYRLDRMFTHLKLAGVLDRISGLVLGHFTGPRGIDVSPDAERIARELTDTHPVPILAGFPFGHALPNLTLPCGVPVELDTDGPRLTVTVQAGFRVKLH
ncbi:MAG: LD-carboxypeptidase [Thermodesulfobacteriota bacterium]